jgi:hypothetical protein
MKNIDDRERIFLLSSKIYNFSYSYYLFPFSFKILGIPLAGTIFSPTHDESMIDIKWKGVVLERGPLILTSI